MYAAQLDKFFYLFSFIFHLRSFAYYNTFGVCNKPYYNKDIPQNIKNITHYSHLLKALCPNIIRSWQN